MTDKVKPGDDNGKTKKEVKPYGEQNLNLQSTKACCGSIPEEEKEQPKAHLTIAVGMEVDKVAAIEREASHMEVDDAPTLAVKDLPMKNEEASTLPSSTAIEDAMKDEAEKKAIIEEVAEYFADSI